MCGRYTLTVNNRPELTGLGLQLQDRYNIAPQTPVVVLNDAKHYQLMPWDYSPPWAREPMHLTNARSETLREKPSFRGAKRCVFIADGWYEWQRETTGKVPWYHHRNGQLLFFAGIYNTSSGCAIVTREAHEHLRFIHHRQPVLLDGRAVEHWLEGHDLFASAITRSVLCHPVSDRVNKPANDDSALIEAVVQTKSSQDSGNTGDLFD